MTEISFTYEDLQNATNGKWVDIPENKFTFSGIKTNTRDDCSGALFIALEGERFNAHDFLDKAIESGAAALCIAEKYHEWANPKWKIPLLIVEDTLLAYQQIARFHKRQFKNLKTVAVTGSIGKTSVKEIIRSILTAAAGSEAVCATEGNTNNQVGVPQNLLRLNNKHRFCVLEMGTNHHGEIEPLSLVGEPDVAVISSIAPCHLEFLEDLRGVAKEKSQIFSGLKTGGTAIIPLECPEVAYLREKAEKFNCLQFGFGKNSDVEAVYLGGNLHGSSIELQFKTSGEVKHIDWKLSGRHQALNAAAGACVALSLGIDAHTIAQGLADCVLPGMRMKISEINGVTWINDAYNASPESVKAALQWLSEFTVQQSMILVLGDMLELGKASTDEHRQVLQKAFSLFPESTFILVGEHMQAASNGLNIPPNATFCANSSLAAQQLATLAVTGKTVFLKASRGIHLENAVPEK